MKSTPCFLIVAVILCAACGEKRRQTDNKPQEPSSGEGTILLTTPLPAELIEGTPMPIRPPGVSPQPVPASEARSPGTGRVFHMPLAPEHSVARRLDHHHAAGTPPGGRHFEHQPPPTDRERYGLLVDNGWQLAANMPLSTFSIDVDTASYANVRGMVQSRRAIPRDAVRLEEMVNYFDYAYPLPADGQPFAVHLANATCPWNPERQLLRVALKGQEIERSTRPPANLVFLIDVSGSMSPPDRLPLVARSLHMLVEELQADDTLAIVVYAGFEGLLLPPTPCDNAGRTRIAAALDNLRAGGSTNGGAGIRLAFLQRRRGCG